MVRIAEWRIVIGSSDALGNPIGRVPAGANHQAEYIASRSRERIDVVWLAAFAIGWAIAIALVARGGAFAFAGLFVVMVLSGVRIGTLIEEHRHLRAEAVAVAGIMEGIGTAGTVREAVQTSFSDLLELFDARAVLV